MNVLDRGELADGSPIQIENWNSDYDFYPYGDCVVVYTKSKSTLDGSFSPKAGEVYRFSFRFENYEESKEAFEKLKSGETLPCDYKKYMDNPKYKDCI